MKGLLAIFFVFAALCSVNSQVVFTESFTVILDSSLVRGSITPEIRIRTQKKVLTEIDNLADISIRIKNSRLTFANRIEFSQYGDELALNEGYLYAELRSFAGRRIIPEYYALVMYDHPRGLQIKYAGGVYGRLRIYTNNNTGLFFGLGPFFEHESWDYSGVEDQLLPANSEIQEVNKIKLASYISYKQTLFSRLNLDISAYYQDEYIGIFEFPRLASSTKLGFQITEHFEALVIYQNIYDYKPVVPIDKWYHNYYATVSILF